MACCVNDDLVIHGTVTTDLGDSMTKPRSAAGATAPPGELHVRRHWALDRDDAIFADLVDRVGQDPARRSLSGTFASATVQAPGLALIVVHVDVVVLCGPRDAGGRSDPCPVSQ